MGQDDVKFSRPVDLSDYQVKDLVAGKALEVGEHSRPRDLTDEDVEALKAGKEINIEEFPTLGSIVSQEKGMASQRVGSRPRDLTDEDVEALRTGKVINYQK